MKIHLDKWQFSYVLAKMKKNYNPQLSLLRLIEVYHVRSDIRTTCRIPVRKRLFNGPHLGILLRCCCRPNHEVVVTDISPRSSSSFIFEHNSNLVLGLNMLDVRHCPVKSSSIRGEGRNPLPGGPSVPLNNQGPGTLAKSSLVDGQEFHQVSLESFSKRQFPRQSFLQRQ